MNELQRRIDEIVKNHKDNAWRLMSPPRVPLLPIVNRCKCGARISLRDLPRAIKLAEPNAFLVVANGAQVELGKRAAARMGRPDITFLVKGDTITNGRQDPD